MYKSIFDERSKFYKILRITQILKQSVGFSNIEVFNKCNVKFIDNAFKKSLIS